MFIPYEYFSRYGSLACKSIQLQIGMGKDKNRKSKTNGSVAAAYDCEKLKLHLIDFTL